MLDSLLNHTGYPNVCSWTITSNPQAGFYDRMGKQTRMERFILTNHLLEETIGPCAVFGYYVYEWLDEGKVFYVGMGHKRRAWNEHLPPIEKRRRDSLDFKVRIVRHYMNKRMAHDYERKLTLLHLKAGRKLINQRIPHVSANKKAR